MTNKIIIKPEDLPLRHLVVKKPKTAQRRKTDVPDSPAPSKRNPTSNRSEDQMDQSATNKSHAKTRMPQEDIVFLCNSCGERLSAPAIIQGRLIVCPSCRNDITVPKPSHSGTRTSSKRRLNYVKPRSFKFFCVRCGKSLQIDRTAVGGLVQCPDCQSQITVPNAPDQ